MHGPRLPHTSRYRMSAGATRVAGNQCLKSQVRSRTQRGVSIPVLMLSWYAHSLLPFNLSNTVLIQAVYQTMNQNPAAITRAVIMSSGKPRDCWSRKFPSGIRQTGTYLAQSSQIGFTPITRSTPLLLETGALDLTLCPSWRRAGSATETSPPEPPRRHN